jgi:hypothetical protein
MSKIIATPIQTEDLCYLGCKLKAKFIFKNEKKCCSAHSNSCTAKRERFSKEVDHSIYSKKSLETRTRLGITKSSQVKAGKTRRDSGHYVKQAEAMRKHWEKNPWNNNPKWRNYKDTEIIVQSKLEEKFLNDLESKYGLDWIKCNVSRGPCFRYVDPSTKKERLYISDFISDNTIYEVKGYYTWDKHGKDNNLRLQNIAKLDKVLESNYNVILVLEGENVLWKEKRENFFG